jgi:hypothetical protein
MPKNILTDIVKFLQRGEAPPMEWCIEHLGGDPDAKLAQAWTESGAIDARLRIAKILTPERARAAVGELLAWVSADVANSNSVDDGRAALHALRNARYMLQAGELISTVDFAADALVVETCATMSVGCSKQVVRNRVRTQIAKRLLVALPPPRLADLLARWSNPQEPQ